MLGVNRRTVARRVSRGDVEVTDVGGTRFYRPKVEGTGDGRTGDRGQSPEQPEVSPNVSPETGPGTALVPAAQVLALVERYERRVDQLLAERHELAGQVGAAVERAGVLAVEVERHRAAHELASVEARRVLELERRDRHAAEVERDRARAEARELRAAVEAAEARAVAAEQLRALPWWRFGERRQLRALLTSPVGGAL